MSTKYEYHNTGAVDYVPAAGDTWYCQTFTPQTTHYITKVKLLLFTDYEVPSSDAVVGIQNTADSHPDGTDLTSATFSRDELTTDGAGEWKEIELTKHRVVKDTVYAIVLRLPDAVKAEVVNWRFSIDGDDYPRGSAGISYDGGVTWDMEIGAEYDFLFEEWGDPIVAHRHHPTIPNEPNIGRILSGMGSLKTPKVAVKYNLIIDSTDGGDVTTPGEGVFPYDASAVVDLVATPDTGYHFVNWTGDVDTIADVNSATTSITMDGDYSVTANFAINTYTLAYTAGAHGTISGTTPQTVDYGADGTEVAAEPDTGYHFVNWSDTSTANPRTDTNVTADISVTANFAINIAYVNGAGNYESASATTINVTATNHTTGNLLVVFVGLFDYTITVFSITDTAGNAYTYIGRIRCGANTIECWYAKNITGNASNIVTATYSASAQSRSITVDQYSGCDITTPLDQSSSGTGSDATPTTGNITTTQADEVLVAGVYLAGTKTIAAGTNYTLRTLSNPGKAWAASEDMMVSATGTYNATFALSGSIYWATIVASFKAAA